MANTQIKRHYQSVETRIFRKISRVRGQIFTATDFEYYGPRNTIDKALFRLLKKEKITLLSRGLYYVPEVSKNLGAIAPYPENIASAVARKQKSDLLVSGARAANDLGLSTQVPGQHLFYTNGWSLKIQYKKMIITFEHKTIRKMAGAGRISGHIFQALRYLGKEHIMKSTIDTICSRLSPENTQTLKKDAPLAPLWMRPFIKEIITKNEKIHSIT